MSSLAIAGFKNGGIAIMGFNLEMSDITPPTIPGISSLGISAATIAILMTLTPGTDASSPLTYNIYEDSIKILTGQAGPTVTLTRTVDNTSHTYGVSMSDPTGNESAIYTYPTAVVWAVTGVADFLSAIVTQLNRIGITNAQIIGVLQNARIL